jgi:hypothetical protein
MGLGSETSPLYSMKDFLRGIGARHRHRRVGGDCVDEIQMTDIKEFTFPGGDLLVDGTVSSDRTDFEF